MSKPKIRQIFRSGSSKVVTLPSAFAGQVGDNVVIYLSPDKKTASIVLVSIPKLSKLSKPEDKDK